MTPQTPGIREKLEPFRRRWLMMAGIVVVISALTYYHFRHQPPRYVATATVFVQTGSSPQVGIDPETDPARRLANAATLAQTPAVAAVAAKQLHFHGNPRELTGFITVTPSSTSDFLGITSTGPDPRRAAAVANAFADAFVRLTGEQTRAILSSEEANVQDQLDQIPPTPANASARAGLVQQLQTLRLTQATGGVERVDPAPVPTLNTASSPLRDVLFAAVLALVLAGILVLGIEAFNRRLRHPMVEAEYGLPLLASIPFSRRAHAAAGSGVRLPAALMERVRGLRTILEHGSETGEAPRTLLVTSAIPGEGKSTLVKNLALAYFESAKSVLVIDADLRRPMLHEFFEAPLAPGLSDVLRSSVSLSGAVQEVQPADVQPAFDPVLVGSRPMTFDVPDEDGGTVPEPDADTGRLPAPGAAGPGRGPVLHLLASGSATADPAALLGSAQLRAVLTEAGASYDVVVIDSPPIMSVSDAIPVAKITDAVVVVARSEFTTREAAQRCRQALERVPGVTVLGVVANAVKNDDAVSRPYAAVASS